MNQEKKTIQFIKKLPKADLHFHFEGAIPWRTIRRLHPEGRHFAKRPPWYKPDGFPSFAAFLDIFQDYVKPCLVSVDHYQAIATDIISWLRAQDIEYVEWNVSLKVMQTNNLPFLDVFRALDQTIKSHNQALKPRIKVVAGINREFPLAEKLRLLAEIETIPCIAGLDIHGWEKERDLEADDSFFQRAKERNWKIKVHAGELGGAQNVRFVIERFGISHICHGARAIEDPSLLELIAQRQIFLELCPSSNLALNVFPSVVSYPLRTMLQQGVKATINSDDPMIFNCNLNSEYALTTKMGLNFIDLAVLALNSIEAAIIPQTMKGKLQQTIMDCVCEADE
ncbi:hypothetical protein ACFL27_18650 [candidate division CSSED10-310 bacterium]|uniref:Adenosine deaminase domain-containing protein n=1 Tax=candidate division CSSED10-310 bacterium TaxID=2855610 RepID=A0ABV6Z197_UNCC1